MNMISQEDLEFLLKVMTECQKKAREIKEITGCEQTPTGNTLFIEIMKRTKK